MNEHKVAYLPLWARYRELFREAGLSNAQIGMLVCAMMDYQFEGKEPEKITKALVGYWLFIRKDLDEAKKKYMQSVENGKKSADKQSLRRKADTPEEPEKTQNNPEHPDHTPEASKSMSMSRSMSMSDTMSGTKKGHTTLRGEQSVSHEKKTYGEFGWVRLTEEQYRQLLEQMGPDELERCITYIDESAQTTGNRNKWMDWYLTLRRCYQNRWHDQKKQASKKQIPCGASGELGDAELEAIRQMMAKEIPDVVIEERPAAFPPYGHRA